MENGSFFSFSISPIPGEFWVLSTRSFCPWPRVLVSPEAARIINPLSSGPSAPEARKIFQNRLFTSGHAIMRHRLMSGAVQLGTFRALRQLSRIYRNTGVLLLGLFLVWTLVSRAPPELTSASIMDVFSRDPPTAKRFFFSFFGFFLYF